MVEPDEATRYFRLLLRREIAGESATIYITDGAALAIDRAVRSSMRFAEFAEHGAAAFERVHDQVKVIFADDPLGGACLADPTEEHLLVELLEARRESPKHPFILGPFSALLIVGAVIDAVRTRRLSRQLADECAPMLHDLWPICAQDPCGQALIVQALTPAADEG